MTSTHVSDISPTLGLNDVLDTPLGESASMQKLSRRLSRQTLNANDIYSEQPLQATLRDHIGAGAL
jgi:hypothetical protein